jgi:hypothetical protein
MEDEFASLSYFFAGTTQAAVKIHGVLHAGNVRFAAG